MSLHDLIAKLEAATGGSRELDFAIETSGWSHQPVRWEECDWDTDGKDWPDGIRYWMPGRGAKSFSTGVPRYTTSIEDALLLGGTENEKRHILASILENWQPPYTLQRCILFGCAAALKSRAREEGK